MTGPCSSVISPPAGKGLLNMPCFQSPLLLCWDWCMFTSSPSAHLLIPLSPLYSHPSPIRFFNKSVSLFKSSQQGRCLGCCWDPQLSNWTWGLLALPPLHLPAYTESSAWGSHLLLGVKARESSLQIIDSAPLPQLKIYWYPGPTLASPLWQLFGKAEVLD